MTYFGTRNIAAIALSASLWAVLNWLIAPIFWQLTHLPILCDMMGTSLLVLTIWWTRKPGAASLMGLVATVLNFILRPGAVHFLGFTAASIVFDAAAVMLGYKNSLDRGLVSSVILVIISLLSTIVAGIIIGTFFMNPMFLSKMFGGVAFFAGLHGVGGIIGGSLGMIIIRGLERRKVIPQ